MKGSGSSGRGGDEQKPFLDHLMEMRSYIIACLAILVITTGLSLAFHNHLNRILRIPLARTNLHLASFGMSVKLVILEPLGGFLFIMKLGLVSGLVLASPLVLLATWRFVSPGLYERERKAIRPVMWLGMFFFLAGCFVAFHWVAPAALKFLVKLNWKLTSSGGWGYEAGQDPGILRLNDYISFLLGMMVGFGIAFEWPLVVLALSYAGIMSPKPLIEKTRYFVVGAFVFGAVLTPPDVISQIFLALCLLSLHGLGIFFSWLVTRGRTETEKTRL